LVVGIRHDAETFSNAVASGSRITEADLLVMDDMNRRLPPATLVLNDGKDDAGLWLGVFTADQPLVTKPWVTDHPNDPRVVALEHACDDPGGAARALVGVGAVFVGSRTTNPAQHPWSERCIRALPGLTLIARAGPEDHPAAAFSVDGAVIARLTGSGP
jgi:hypothetical protein